MEGSEVTPWGLEGRRKRNTANHTVPLEQDLVLLRGPLRSGHTKNNHYLPGWAMYMVKTQGIQGLSEKLLPLIFQQLIMLPRPDP